jgi:hypothetical protein
MHGIQQIKLKIGLLACRPGDLKRLQHLASCHDLRSHVSVPVEEVAMPCMHFETTNDAGRLTTCMCTYMHVDVVVGNGLARERAQGFFYRPVTPNRRPPVPVYLSGLPVTGR